MTSRLHPVSWVALAIAWSALALTSTNWMIDAAVIAVVMGVGVTAFTRLGAPLVWALTSGLAQLIVQVLLTLVAGTMTLRGRVLFFLPEFVPGPGASLGGPVSEEQVFVGLERGLTLCAVLVVVALALRAKPAPAWCELARAGFGRAGQLAEPVIWLGPALDATRGVRPARRLVAVADQTLISVRAWSAVARRTPPRVTRSVGTALLGVAALAVAGWATVSGLYVFLGDGEATKIAASLVAGVGLAVWGSARAWFSGALTGLGAEDWLALGSCLLLGLALTASVFTGESVGLASRPELATLPWLVMGTLVLSAAVYGLLGGASGDGRT